MNCTITSLTQTNTYNNVINVTIPAVSGQMQILPGHAESFVLLQKGIVIIKLVDDKKQKIQIEGGECYVQRNDINIIL